MRATDIALSILFVIVFKEITAVSYNFVLIECRDVDQMTFATEVCSFDGPRANIVTLIKRTLSKVIVSWILIWQSYCQRISWIRLSLASISLKAPVIVRYLSYLESIGVHWWMDELNQPTWSTLSSVQSKLQLRKNCFINAHTKEEFK